MGGIFGGKPKAPEPVAPPPKPVVDLTASKEASAQAKAGVADRKRRAKLGSNIIFGNKDGGSDPKVGY